MKHLLLVVAISSVLLGCQTNVPEPEVKTEPKIVQPLVQHIIYFDFDKDLAPENIGEILMPHVRHLIQNPTKKLLVEGAADEVGPFDYNIELGLRRAERIKKFLLAGGISEKQIIVRSIGVQRPLNLEKKPYSLPRNRRVTLVY